MALFPYVGSSASWAVTWKTDVPAQRKQSVQTLIQSTEFFREGRKCLEFPDQHLFELDGLPSEGLAVLPAAPMTRSVKHAGALCPPSHKTLCMPPGHLHIQWVMLNVRVRILMSRMGNAVHVVTRCSDSRWMGLLHSHWPLPPAAHRRWIWCDSLIFDFHVNTVHTACERVCAGAWAPNSPPPPLLPGPRRQTLLKQGAERTLIQRTLLSLLYWTMYEDCHWIVTSVFRLFVKKYCS